MVDPRLTALIEQSGFLSVLPREPAERLAAAARGRMLRPGEYVRRPGDPLTLAAWLQWGIVYAYFELSDGSRLPYLVAWPNDVAFQGLAATDEFAVWLMALTPVRYFAVPVEAITKTSRDYPGLTEALLRYAIRREHARAVWMAHLVSLQLEPRIRLILARMAAEMGKPQGEGYLLGFTVTRQALATIARASRDDVGRVLRELQDAETLQRMSGRKLLIPDFRRLLGEDLLESAATLGLIAAE
jgi:CRP-like cAMP-binding protein